MANKSLFKSLVGRMIPAVNAVNAAGGVAYERSPKAKLAQYAATGCLGDTFYASAEDQLATVLSLCDSSAIEPEFIARTALYARQKAHMKDLPALLCATLTVYGPGLLAEVFDRVIDDGRMLRNFVQIVRSGVVGRKSLGTLPKRLVNAWFDRRSDEAIFRASVGNSPSLADVIRMTHPKPKSASRAALYGYLIGQPHDTAQLPEIVKAFEAFKAGESKELPDVPFQMLTSLDLSAEQWKQIARKGSWQMVRQNLNTFARHGVFDGDEAIAKDIARKLADPASVKASRVLPYQLMVAYAAAGPNVPRVVRDALQTAMEIATANVPKIDGRVIVCPDVSGSMQSPVTGVRRGATTAVRCLDVAALVAACFVRTNVDAEVIPFSDDVIRVDLNPRDSVLTNAARLAALPSGGTNCSAPLRDLNRRKAKGDLVVFVSDNASWVDTGYSIGTGTMAEWALFKQRNPQAKLVCIDITPGNTTQAASRDDVLNVGGFSDAVFDVVVAFLAGSTGDHWVRTIEAVSL
ncbi:MAG: hypothetical protein QM754_00115 [Tepidisphaeraceae bacterium]